jgi:hypothetical protein
MSIAVILFSDDVDVSRTRHLADRKAAGEDQGSGREGDSAGKGHCINSAKSVTAKFGAPD